MECRWADEPDFGSTMLYIQSQVVLDKILHPAPPIPLPLLLPVLLHRLWMFFAILLLVAVMAFPPLPLAIANYLGVVGIRAHLRPVVIGATPSLALGCAANSLL